MRFIFFGEIFPDQIINVTDSEKALEYIEKKYYRNDIVSLGREIFDSEPVIKISAWADISEDDEEECISYERRPMYLCTEYSYHKLSLETIKLLTGE
jgi:hypothetical protein